MSEEKRFESVESFVEAAMVVCREARRLGSHRTSVSINFDGGPVALAVDNAPDITDEHRVYGVGWSNWNDNPIFQLIRERLAPVGPETLDLHTFLSREAGYTGPATFPFVSPLINESGWFGTIMCGMLEPITVALERDLGVLATQLSVWCTRKGIGAVARSRHIGLGPRQHQIALLAARGLSNAEIGQKLGVSINTVKTRLKQVFERSRVNSRTELASVTLRLDPLHDVPIGVTCVGDVKITRGRT